MRFRTFSSGSDGNSALVWQSGTYILIDAGISLRRITKSLAECGITPDKLSAVLITHEHRDHIGGLDMLHKHYPDIPLYMSCGTARAIGLDDAECGFSGTLVIGDLLAGAFETSHDSEQSYGFTFSDGKRKLAYATDLGKVTAAVQNAVLGAHMAFLESNHDSRMLRSGPYPYALKRRIAGDSGHLSNDDAADFAALLAANGTEQISLAHLSHENNAPQIALDTVVSRLNCYGYRDTAVDVAPRWDLSNIYEV
ncbi:MAG: MBL fold metallo-hydrolase [Oscillospiraceae bacterium]|jgi:phosphoribosyl 1,2-cyclic phosphodiesterase|nr:MBL fold metallo-hydrolase [Oscillospiraceae bacterium]MDR2360325.1 MBL fold metallo-hydrolase [Oscillospiraceae bacterium]